MVLSTGIMQGNGAVYLGTTDGASENTLAAYDVSTGSILWQAKPASPGAPTLAAEGLLAVSASGWVQPNSLVHLEVWNARAGVLKWAYQAPSKLDSVDIRALINGTLYVQTIDQSDDVTPPTDPVTGNPTQHSVLLAFNASTGVLRWQYDLGNLPYGEGLITFG